MVSCQRGMYVLLGSCVANVTGCGTIRNRISFLIPICFIITIFSHPNPDADMGCAYIPYICRRHDTEFSLFCVLRTKTGRYQHCVSISITIPALVYARVDRYVDNNFLIINPLYYTLLLSPIHLSLVVIVLRLL